MLGALCGSTGHNTAGNFLLLEASLVEIKVQLFYNE